MGNLLSLNERKITIFSVLMILVFQIFYKVINELGGPFTPFITLYDNLITFTDYYVISFIYLFFSLVYPLHVIYLSFTNKLKTLKIVFGLTVLHIISFILMLKFPACQDRSLIYDKTFLTEIIWALDNNCNMFPSLHCGISSVLISVNGKNNKLLSSYYCIVILTCLLLKQHTIADAIAGVIIGYISYRFFDKNLIPFKG